MRSTCSLCGCALACQEEFDRGICDPCWAPSRSRRSPGAVAVALVVGIVAGVLAVQVASLERDLEAARFDLAEARATQKLQDAAIASADRRLAQLGPPCAALVDLNPALSRPARVRGQR